MQINSINTPLGQTIQLQSNSLKNQAKYDDLIAIIELAKLANSEGTGFQALHNYAMSFNDRDLAKLFAKSVIASKETIKKVTPEIDFLIHKRVERNQNLYDDLISIIELAKSANSKGTTFEELRVYVMSFKNKYLATLFAKSRMVSEEIAMEEPTPEIDYLIQKKMKENQLISFIPSMKEKSSQDLLFKPENLKCLLSYPGVLNIINSLEISAKNKSQSNLKDFEEEYNKLVEMERALKQPDTIEFQQIALKIQAIEDKMAKLARTNCSQNEVYYTLRELAELHQTPGTSLNEIHKLTVSLCDSIRELNLINKE